MKIKALIEQLQEIQERCPNGEIYFTDGNRNEWFETFFQTFNIDEENNTVEMLFDTEEEN